MVMNSLANEPWTEDTKLFGADQLSARHDWATEPAKTTRADVLQLEVVDSTLSYFPFRATQPRWERLERASNTFM